MEKTLLKENAIIEKLNFRGGKTVLVKKMLEDVKTITIRKLACMVCEHTKMHLLDSMTSSKCKAELSNLLTLYLMWK